MIPEVRLVLYPTELKKTNLKPFIILLRELAKLKDIMGHLHSLGMFFI